MNVLMVGVDKERIGGMWTVAENYIKNEKFNSSVNLYYVATSTCGSILKRSFKMLRGYMQCVYVLATKRIDLVHIHMAEKGSVFRKGRVARWAKMLNKKVIIHMHAGPFMAWYDTLSLQKRKKVCKIIEQADKVFVLGEFWKKEMESILPQDKIEVLYNGVNCLNENPYSSESKDIVFFGLLKRTKGIYDLIDATALLDKKIDPDIKVRLCGTDEEGNIPEYIQNKNLQNRIILEGWVGAEKRDRILREAMISVLPSYFEGLSMTVIEAMAYGVPVVTTNISTMPELIADSGMLVEPGDSQRLAELIYSMISEKQLRKNCSDRLYSRAKEIFSIETMVANTVNVYSKLLL